MTNARTLCRDMRNAAPSRPGGAKTPLLTDNEERARLARISRKVWEQAKAFHAKR